LITIIDEEFGRSLTNRVLEVEETVDDKGYEVTPTLGVPEKSILEKVSGGSGSSGGGGGGSDIAFIFTQPTAAAVWEIHHNLGKMPSVTVVDSSGSVVAGETVYLDRNCVKITFSAAFAGAAYLN
jgi:hypothetical protein